MGATEFSTTAKGRTAHDAFQAAREEAAYWHGHGGYTGSVAEKHDFVLITDTGKELQARLGQAIKGLREVQRELREPGRRDVASLVEAVQRRVGARLELDELLLRGSKSDALEELRSTVDRLRDIKGRCRARMKPAEIADVLVTIGDRRIRDKWGPSGCIDLTPRNKRDKEFLFFGIASC